MDREDMTDQECKVVLTDFGTACNIGPFERLSDSVGTKPYWSPEFYDKDYAAKVDVWAMGIVMYGLLTGCFPFRDEADVRQKDVKLSKRIHPVCQDYIRNMLQKIEGKRHSAAELASHEWVNRKSVQLDRHTSGGATTPENEGKGEGFRPDSLHAGKQERRQELINRLNKEHEKMPKALKPKLGASPALTKDISRFAMPEKNGVQNVFEWWPANKVAVSKLLDPWAGKEGQTEKSALGQDTTDIQVYSKMLEEYKIDTSAFGTGKYKSLETFVAELSSGNARLLLDATEHKKLVRTVNIVLLRLRSPNGLLLVETSETFSDGRHRDTIRLPGTKKEPHENMRQTAERVAKETLNMNINCIELDLLNAERFEVEMDSPTYPGIWTVYRKEIVDGVIIASDTASLRKIGLERAAAPTAFSITTKDQQAITKTFNWMGEAAAQDRGVRLRQEGAETVSALVRAPMGLSEEALRAHLLECKVDPGQFGKDNTKTLKEFSDELIQGEATLLQDSEGQLLRVVDLVVLVLTRGKDGEVLVQAEQAKSNGETLVLNRLPGSKRLPNENQFTTVRRFLRKHLELDDVHVNLDKDICGVVEEEMVSPSYPGIRTLYRKRLIAAKICDPAAKSCKAYGGS
jgi:hypothetical protein